jgi:hypothetical protein
LKTLNIGELQWVRESINQTYEEYCIPEKLHSLEDLIERRLGLLNL